LESGELVTRQSHGCWEKHTNLSNQDLKQYILQQSIDKYIADDDINGLRKLVDDKSFVLTIGAYISNNYHRLQRSMLKFLLATFPNHANYVFNICIHYNDIYMMTYIIDNFTPDLTEFDIGIYISTSFKIEFDIVKLLIDNGVKISADCLGKLHCLEMTYDYDDEEVVDLLKLLLEHQADVHSNNDYVLRCCARLCYVSSVKLLLENGANIHANNDEAVRYCGRLDDTYSTRDMQDAETLCLSTTKILLENGANISANNNETLMRNICRGYVSVVQLLISYGADIHCVSQQKIDLSQNKISIINLLMTNQIDALKIFNIMLNHESTLFPTPYTFALGYQNVQLIN